MDIKNFVKTRAVVVTRSVKHLLPTPEICSSNPVIVKFYLISTLLKRKRKKKVREWPNLKTKHLINFEASSKLPLEQCTLSPKQECRDVSILVPSLVPVEKCLDIPKEVCDTVLMPRKINRVSTRLYCDGTSADAYGGGKKQLSLTFCAHESNISI